MVRRKRLTAAVNLSRYQSVLGLQWRLTWLWAWPLLEINPTYGHGGPGASVDGAPSVYSGTRGSLPMTVMAKSILTQEFIVFSFGDAQSAAGAQRVISAQEPRHGELRLRTLALEVGPRKLRQNSYQRPTEV